MPVPCSGGIRLGNRLFRCWKKEGHGRLDLIGAVAESCDVYFYQLGLRLGLDAIIEDGVLMGFRDRSGDGPGERAEPDLAGDQAVLRPAVRAALLEPAGHRAELLHRPGREHPDADQHGGVLQGLAGAGVALDALRRARQARREARPRAHARSWTGLRAAR